jgi:hypothetical protein
LEFPQKIENRYVYLTHVYCGTIHNIQAMESAYVSINERVDKENLVYILNGVLFKYKEE